MKLLNILTIKNLLLNKKRTIVTIIGIILSVALITAVSCMYSSLIETEISYEISQYGDFHVAYFDVDNITTLSNNRHVDELHITKSIGYAYISSSNEYKPYVYVEAFTTDSLENLAITLLEGRLPLNDSEIVVPDHLSSNGGAEYSIGDTITLEVGTRIRDGVELNQYDAYELDLSEEIVNTTTKTYTVVGIVKRPSTKIEPYSAPGYTIITYLSDEDAKENVNAYVKYTNKGLSNYLSVTANILGIDGYAFSKYMTDDYLTEEQFDMIYEKVSGAKYEYVMNTYLIELETDPLSLTSGGNSLIVVIVIVCLIIVVTSIFCIKNSFDISITEKIRQYGMLKSIGATGKQIKKNVFYEAFILGVIGIPLGVISGILASYILVIVCNIFLKDVFTDGMTLVFSASIYAILFACFLGIITIFASAYKSARRASLVAPIEAIRGNDEVKIKSKKLKCPKIINKLFGIGGEISYKNIKRNKRKYRTTVISITISVIVFISLYSFMDQAFTMVDNELNIAEYNLSLSDFNTNLYEKVLDTTYFDDIMDVTVYRNYGLYITNPKYNSTYLDAINSTVDDFDGYINVIAVGDQEYKKYIEKLGLDYDEVKNKAILIGEVKIGKVNSTTGDVTYKHYNEFTYTQGDTINLSDDLINFDIEIAYVTDEVPYAMNENSTSILVSDEFYDEYINYNSYAVIYYNSSDVDTLQEKVEKYLEGEDYYIYNLEENIALLRNVYIVIAIFLYGFIIVISLIGITNIFNTITTSMSLRKREFAMLKSVGMTSKEFNRMITLESIFTCAKSLLVGIPIGILLSIIIYRFMGYQDDLGYTLPLPAIIACIIVVILLILSIMKYSINKINKQNTIETIRNEVI